MEHHINNVQRRAIVERVLRQGQRCPGCGSRELDSDELLRPYADGSADVWLWCTSYDDDSPNGVWRHRLSREDLLELRIRTGP